MSHYTDAIDGREIEHNIDYSQTSQTKRESPIIVKINELDKTLNEICKQVEVLTIQLTPVLTTSVEHEKIEEKDNDFKNKSPIENKLNVLYFMAKKIRCEIEEIRRRLSV